MNSRGASQRYLVLAIGLVTVGLLGLSACGSNAGPPNSAPQTSTQTPATPGPSQTPTQPSTSASIGQPTTQPNQRSLSVYFFSRLSKDHLAPAARPIGSAAVLADALRALSAGPNQEEKAAGFTTQMPIGINVRKVDLKNGIATIELESARADENTGLPDAALAQVVFTATQFPTVRAVKVEADGQHAVAPHQSPSHEPSSGDALLSRADFEDWSPAVLIESPVFGTTINSPVRIHGTANTFEAVFRIELTDWDGRIVASRIVMATSGSGTRGTFDVTIPYATAKSGSGEIIASFDSPKDGSRIVVSETPVIVAP